METQVALASSKSSVVMSHSGQDSISTYVGLSVLIYVLLLFVLAPRRTSQHRRKSSL